MLKSKIFLNRLRSKIKRINYPVISKIRDQYRFIDLKNSRLSSFPFVSGDTFRCMADFIIDKGTDFSELPLPAIMDMPDKSVGNTLIIFIELSSIETESHQNDFLNWLSSIKQNKIKTIFHNGDLTPEISFFLTVKQYCNKVYSVNILDTIPDVIPIPIGLENLHHLNNGLLNDFMNTRQFMMLNCNGDEQRTTHIFSSFNPGTNTLERNALLNEINKSRHGFSGTKMTPAEYRQKVINSLFVLSPPGNGLDCHRTWEAIALGAVPVIKKGFLASSLVNNLPMYEVDDWGYFLSLSNNELESIYQATRNIPDTMALMPYWCRRITCNH